MARNSESRMMQAGIYYSFINPEGSLKHFAPRDSLYKKVMVRAPDGKSFEYYTQRWLPHSTNINGNQRDYYTKRGWFHHTKLPVGWKDTNEKLRTYVIECADQVDQQTATLKAMEKWMFELVKQGRTEVAEIVKREIEGKRDRAEEESSDGDSEVKVHYADSSPKTTRKKR